MLNYILFKSFSFHGVNNFAGSKKYFTTERGSLIQALTIWTKTAPGNKTHFIAHIMISIHIISHMN